MAQAQRKPRRSQAKQPSPSGAGSTDQHAGDHRTSFLKTAAPYIAVGLFALAVRAIYFFELRNQLPFATLITDSRVYDDWAQRISAGDWLGSEVFYQSPLYPYFLAVIYRVLGYDIMTVRIIQALLGATACSLVAWAGRSFISHRAGIAAGVLLAVYSPAIFFDGLIQKASLDLFFMALVLALMGQFLTSQKTGWLLGLGVATGALILNRENARLLYPVLIAWLLLYFHAQVLRRRVIGSAVLTLGIALVLVPVGWRNWYVGGEFLLSTSQLGPNLYIGNHAGASGLYVPLVPGRSHTMHERADAVRLAEEAMGRELTAGEVSDYWRDQVTSFIRNSPGEWLSLMAWKTYLVFHAVELVDSEGIEVFMQFSYLLRGLGWFTFGLLVPLAVVGAWGTRSQWRRLTVLYAFAFTMAFSVALFFVFARYRYPLVPLCAIFAGAAVSSAPAMLRSWRGGHFWREWGPGVLVAAVLLIPLNWPMPQFRDDAVAFLNYGKELNDEGRTAEAEVALRRAIEIQPRLVGAHHNLGIALATQKRNDEAIEQYRIALSHDPNYGRSHWMLGKQLYQRGQANEALGHLRQAAALLPDIDLLRVDLAQALMLTGDPQAATDELRVSLQLNPDSGLAANNLAWILATSRDSQVRNGTEALAVLDRQGVVDHPALLDTRAAVYAELGRFDEALALIDRAIQLAAAEQQAALVAQLEAHRQLYQLKQPLREDF